MKFKNRAKKYGRRILMIEGAEGEGNQGGGGGGNTAGGEGNANANANADGTQNNGNNGGANEFNFDTIWASPPEGTETQSDGTQQTVVVQQQVAEPTADEAFAKHVEGLNLMQGFDAEKALANPEDLAKGIQSLLVQTYKAAMMNANTLVDERVNAAREEMQQQTSSTLQGQKVMDAMYTALPFTKQPAYQPIAEGILTQILKTPGVTPEQAITHVKDYFVRLGGEIAGQAGNTNGKGGVNGSGFPAGGAINNQANSPKVGKDFWSNFLKGQPEQTTS